MAHETDLFLHRTDPVVFRLVAFLAPGCRAAWLQHPFLMGVVTGAAVDLSRGRQGKEQIVLPGNALKVPGHFPGRLSKMVFAGRMENDTVA